MVRDKGKSVALAGQAAFSLRPEGRSPQAALMVVAPGNLKELQNFTKQRSIELVSVFCPRTTPTHPQTATMSLDSHLITIAIFLGMIEVS